ncbi:MAG TPA: helix-turn-helix transcriptional regulator [Rickettsia endosymbiont of Bembidion nr. Transversale]|nr:helix-turn-helix transcriptional regulator [Rickettsia endosymbiont of Bembidion nr. Transversale]
MLKIDKNKITQIQGIIFTSREIDILSCLLNINGSKRIAEILNISPRTVEGHIKNILVKIGKNSREDIKDFVSKSDENSLIQKHYSQLLLDKIFLAQLIKISSQLKKKNITCYIDMSDFDRTSRIAEYLRIAGITIINTYSTSYRCYQLAILNKHHLLEISKNSNKLVREKIFLCNDKDLRDKFLDQYTN